MDIQTVSLMLNSDLYRRSVHCLRLCAVSVLLLLLCTQTQNVNAQTRQPVIITDANSTRAIALEALARTRDPFPVTTVSFVAGTDTRTRILVFVLNLDLLPGEGANALTANGEDSAHPARTVHAKPPPLSFL